MLLHMQHFHNILSHKIVNIIYFSKLIYILLNSLYICVLLFLHFIEV